MSEIEKKEVEVKNEVVPEVKPETAEVKVTEAQIAEDAKRTGIKDAVVDSDTVAIEKEKEQSEKIAMPSFFVTETDRRKIEADVLAIKETGKIVSISRAGLNLNFKEEFPFLNHNKIWFEFTVPTYEDMSSYRQRSAMWRKEAGQMLVDKLQLRNFFLVWHLKDWSLTDKDGKKVEITHDKDGSMTAESIKMMYSVQPSIIDIILTAFEKDILLT